jgi:hypothetical protein
MNPAILSHLLVSFDRSIIDERFDFFILSTGDKYIDRGAYVLDKPTLGLKAVSVAFDNTRSAFLMFKKGTISSKGWLLEALGDEKLSIKTATASDLSDSILFRLFLFSLSNFETEELSFNNLTGKLYVVYPEWISKNKKSFKALDFDVDQNLDLQVNATTFSSIALIHDKKLLAKSAKYTFSFSNHSLKRVLSSDGLDNVYIRKTLGDGKTQIPFLDFKKGRITNNKAYAIFKTLAALRDQYGELLQVDFEKKAITDQVSEPKEKRIDELCAAYLRFQTINCINLDQNPSDQDYFDSMVEALQDKVSVSAVQIADGVDPAGLNVVFLHDEAFYQEHGYVDPYPLIDKRFATQCVTKEEVGDYLLSHNDAVLTTILKELLIKSDILHTKTISLDRWSDYHFLSDWIFGIERNDIQYFMIIHPDGQFCFENSGGGFAPFENTALYPLSEALEQSSDKTKSIVSDSKGNVILISSSGQFLLPNPDIFTATSIRSEQGREAYLSGLTDINLFAGEKTSFYSVGPIGKGMNGTMDKGVLLYKVDVIKGQDITKDLLQTMSVTFVKYHEFTVLPYPLKYLREYALILESIQAKKVQR